MMSTIKIEGFDPEKLEDLAEKQTAIYNAENFPDSFCHSILLI